MGVCENIPTWIFLSGDLAFSHQHGIYGFKFPKRFSELSQEKTSLYSPLFYLQADRGFAAVAFFGGAEGGVLKKRVLRSAGYGFPRRKKSSASLQYCN